MIFANKADLVEKRIVDSVRLKEYADSLGIEAFETSAKTGQNVQEAFISLIREILRKRCVRRDEERLRSDGKY